MGLENISIVFYCESNIGAAPYFEVSQGSKLIFSGAKLFLQKLPKGSVYYRNLYIFRLHAKI